jgi:aspartate/methionine/tyrosine aminotransferase
MNRRGVCYDVGLVMGINWRPEFDLHVVHRELEIIRNDLHFEPRGAFYAFPQITSTGLTSDQFAEQLIREESVAVVPGTAFGAADEGHVRCCCATSEAEIKEALVRIKRFVERRRASHG